MIRIAVDLLTHIEAQALQAYPKECCGFLVGRKSADDVARVTRIVPSVNTASGDTKDAFEIDPQVRFDLMRDLTDSPDAIIGHYHSHPDHPAEPSQTDLDMAFEPKLIWLITAVTQTRAEQTRAWQLNRSTRTIHAVQMDITQKP